jgi:hypothetical protein
MPTLEVIPVSTRPGRTPTLTPRAFIRICRLIRIGWSVPDACRSESVTYRRFRQLCQTRPTYQRHFEKADQVRFQYRRETMERIVAEHAERNWISAAWWLERRLPNEFSLRNKIERDSPTEVASSNLTEIRILTVPDADFLELQKEPEYRQLPDGGLEMQHNNLKIMVYSMSHNERLLG